MKVDGINFTQKRERKGGAFVYRCSIEGTLSHDDYNALVEAVIRRGFDVVSPELVRESLEIVKKGGIET